jgi:hypothetical protein
MFKSTMASMPPKSRSAIEAAVRIEMSGHTSTTHRFCEITMLYVSYRNKALSIIYYDVISEFSLEAASY